MFWTNFQQLCFEEKKFPNNVCAELGLSNATCTHWKNGAIPRESTLKKIADYFGVTVEELISDYDDTNLSDIQIAYEKAPDYIKRSVRKLLDLPINEKEEFHFITMLEVPTPSAQQEVAQTTKKRTD